MSKGKSFLWFCIFLQFNAVLTFGQSVTGKIMDENSGNPIANASIELQPFGEVVLSDGDGKFTLVIKKAGDYSIEVELEGYTAQTLDFTSDGTNPVVLGFIFLSESKGLNASDKALPGFLNQDQLDALDEVQEVSSLLTAAWDPFLSNAQFNFSITRFRPRGYDQNHSLIYLNGLPFNYLSDGRYFWSLWGGLNDATRRQYAQIGLNSTDYSVGGIAGVTEIDMRASSQRRQTRVTYSLANRSYIHRLMFTHSTGLMESGWSFSISGSRRWGQEGYAEGTYYDAYAYFGAIEKEINASHSLGLTFFGSPHIRGRASSSVQEMYDLVGSNYYNPNWGYQNGEKRNSREYRRHQPVLLLTHDWTLSDDTKLVTSFGYQTGNNGSTRLDWLFAPDPRPDYYRKLPSFYTDSPEIADAVGVKIASSIDEQQVQWDEFYRINASRSIFVEDINGDENNDSFENISGYIVEEQRFNNDKYVVQTHVNTQLKQNIGFKAGIQLQYDKNKTYKVLDDLLGGSYYLDIDEFAILDFAGDNDRIQNDLRFPNRLLKEGDVFGYNYNIHNQNVNAWSVVDASLRKVDLSLALSIQQTRFWREGLMQNGKFPDNSLGPAEKQSFLHGMAKAGATYKINGRNYAYLNGGFMTRAPYSRFAYLSPRVRDDVVTDLTTEKIRTGEIGYVLRHPKVNARITGFFTRSDDQINTVSFYHDEERSFVNYAIRNIDKVNYGVEFGANVNVSPYFNVGTAWALGEYYYDSRPAVTITQENDAEVLIQDRTVYLKGYNIGGIPQVAGMFEVEYQNPNFWSVGLSANYFDEIYIDPNPDRRTSAAVEGVSKIENPDLWNAILGQEKYDPGLTLDLSARKSFKVGDSFLYVNLFVTNILNTRDFKTGGFEQLRFDFLGKDVNRFAPRYYYAYGTTYMLMLSYRI